MGDTAKVYPMRRATIFLLTLSALILPRLGRAQESFDDNYGPPPYNDVDDGQALRVAAYILAPFGYALEWTVTRPLHTVATDSPLAPVLSGDTDVRFFGQTDNADRLPPATFAPFRLPANPNAIESDAQSRANPQPADTGPPIYQRGNYRSIPYSSGGQSAIH
jgi:hypothetical protein